jgi:hypothetical protein
MKKIARSTDLCRVYLGILLEVLINDLIKEKILSPSFCRDLFYWRLSIGLLPCLPIGLSGIWRKKVKEKPVTDEDPNEMGISRFCLFRGFYAGKTSQKVR